MNEQFRKFKNKMLRHAVIESVVAGLVAGLIVVAAILLPVSLNFIQINIGIYFAAGIGAAVAVGGVTFLIVRPSDKKVARRLDKDLALNEKVQTMVAYASSQDSMAVIQRGDASDRLAAAGTKAVAFKRLWLNIAAAAVAVILFVSSVVVAVLIKPRPAAAEEYTPTRYKIDALRDLVIYVNDSGRKFDDECKATITGEINNIIDLFYDEETDTILTVTVEEQVKVATTAMVNIDLAVEKMINADEFGLAFSAGTEDTMLSDMGMHIASLTVDTTRQEFSSLKLKLLADESSPLPEAVATYSGLINDCASAAGNGDNAVLYGAFIALSEELGEVSGYQSQGGETPAEFAERVNAAVNDIVDAASIIVVAEVNNQATIRSDGRNNVIYRIQSILEIPDDQMPELSEVVSDVQTDPETPGEGEEDKPPEGGGGSGETVFPGDDVIYGYSDKDEAYGYYEYGEILNGYEEMFNHYKDEGTLSDEYIAFLERFFNSLRNDVNAS